MDRRWFLGLCATSGISVLSASGQKPKVGLSNEVYSIIAAVQQHMFPDGGSIPSAMVFHATQFTSEAIIHPTYDKDIRKFVIEGAEELQSREKQQFLNYDAKQREKALRAYEKTGYGSGWLDRIMLLSLEGLLSDPVYGGNSNKLGWKALKTKGGDPRPASRYVQL